jgi:hypothetical protein
VVAALALAACGGSEKKQAEAEPQATQKPPITKDPRSGDGYTSWARSDVTTGDGVQLKLTKFEKSYAGTSYDFVTACSDYGGAMSSEVSANGSDEFCYGSFHPPATFLQVDTGFYFYYDILVPKGGGWGPSGYYVDAATKVALIGDPKIDCSVKKSGSTTPDNGAPYKCATSFTESGNNSRPHWKITASPVQVVDATDSSQVQQAANLIGANCQSFDTPSCDWEQTQKSSVFEPDQKDWTSITDWADSCPPVEKEHLTQLTFDRSVDIAWKDTVGGKLTAKIKIGAEFVASVEAGLETSYEHSITQTDTWSTGYKYTIPYNYKSALYLQHGMLTVTGDFSIVSGGDRYLVKNGTFTFPINQDVQVENRGQTIKRGYVHHVDIPCSQKTPAKGAPPPSSAQVGLATRSQ